MQRNNAHEPRYIPPLVGPFPAGYVQDLRNHSNSHRTDIRIEEGSLPPRPTTYTHPETEEPNHQVREQRSQVQREETQQAGDGEVNHRLFDGYSPPNPRCKWQGNSTGGYKSYYKIFGSCMRRTYRSFHHRTKFLVFTCLLCVASFSASVVDELTMERNPSYFVMTNYIGKTHVPSK